ncbi:MAG TPA: HdeD family acid-resistance protein [Trebonia sp.]|jgi:uncharacterized membrane protein HdeD (DUF308 family)|nr:HdeD family acid-resistance protein [Trebonia sp.]
MTSERSDEAPAPDLSLGGLLDWRAAFLVGLATAILGIIVAALPETSLAVIAVLLGVLVIFSGIYNVVEAFRGEEHGRVWRGIAGVVFIVAGLVLIRHLHLSLALIGLVIGLTWVVQGLAALIAGLSGAPTRMGGGWAIFFGVISLIAGIVVISAPIASITTLAVLMGIWFVVMGIMEMFGAFAFRHATRAAAHMQEQAGDVNVPGQRASAAAADADSTATGRKVTG